MCFFFLIHKYFNFPLDYFYLKQLVYRKVHFTYTIQTKKINILIGQKRSKRVIVKQLSQS